MKQGYDFQATIDTSQKDELLVDLAEDDLIVAADGCIADGNKRWPSIGIRLNHI